MQGQKASTKASYPAAESELSKIAMPKGLRRLSRPLPQRGDMREAVEKSGMLLRKISMAASRRDSAIWGVVDGCRIHAARP